MRNLLTTAILFLIVVSPAVAKSRAVRPIAQTVLFKSSVVDSVTGKPVIGATVALGNISTVTDTRGAFTLLLPATPVTLVISRSGYETAEFTVTPSAGATTPVPFRLQSRQAVIVTTTDGQRIQLDLESVRFVNALPLSNPVSVTAGNFCLDGNEIDVDIADISRINGPSATASGGSCCPRDTEFVDVTLKSGQQSHVTLIYSCRGYDVFLGGREHDTFQQVFVKFSDLRQVEFP
jgi:hypothetical protein